MAVQYNKKQDRWSLYLEILFLWYDYAYQYYITSMTRYTSIISQEAANVLENLMAFVSVIDLIGSDISNKSRAFQLHHGCIWHQ